MSWFPWLRAASAWRPVAVALALLGPLAPGVVMGAAGQPADGPFTLRGALSLARTRSPARQASAARVEAADLSRAWAGRLLNPVTELRWENMAPGLRGNLPADIFATVTQPIELGGKREARRGLAAATANGARASLWATEKALDAEVARRFLGVIRQRDRAATLSEEAVELAEYVRVLGRRVAEGVTAEADVRKLETEHARVDTAAALARIAAIRELATLSALVGWSPPPALDALERPSLPPTAARDVATAVEERPDVRLAASRLEASTRTLSFERARSVPDLNISGGFKRTAGYDTGLLAVLVPIPIFERNRVNVVLAEGNSRAAQLELEQTRLLAAGDVRATQMAAEELIRRSSTAAAQLVEPADVVRRSARAAFVSGAGDLLRLVDAERVYADARLTANELALDAVLAAVEARLARAEDAVP